MTGSTGSVRLNAITKRFRSGAIGVDAVSLVVQPGEFVTFLGPSGSGKTTTLNTIAGFVQPTAGTVEIGGSDVTALPPSRRNLGVVFQNYALFPHMTVKQNIAFGLHGRGLRKTEIATRIEEALSMVRLDGLGDRTPKQISGGQQQRVALARALVYRPPVLLMDEPLGALDKALRDRMQVEIGRIHREVGTTFLFVTHDQDEALGLSDRIVLFDRGRVVQVGTPSDLYERPTSLFAARFLGESNVFRGVVSGRGCMRFADTTLRFDARHAEGSSVAMVVRPERLRVRAGSAVSRSSENAVAARVADVSYFGSFTKITLEYRDGSVGLVHGGLAPSPTISRGDELEVCWDPEHGIVIPDTEAGT